MKRKDLTKTFYADFKLKKNFESLGLYNIIITAL